MIPVSDLSTNESTLSEGESLSIPQDLIDQLKQVVPQAFTEGRIDLNQLKTLIGEGNIAEGERYALTWAGKSEAYKVLQTATTQTLNPEPGKSIKWDETENVLIEGENLEVLKVLQKSYYGRIKMIYIDPPYNTGSDSFIYPDKFSETKEDYLKRIGDKDDEGLMMKEGLFRKNSKESGQFHSNWLNMMLPRLFLARNLLKEDGVIFVSIDDNEQTNLKMLMDEIFGAENFIEQLIWKKRYGGGAKEKYLVNLHEYVLMYAKSKEKINPIFVSNNQDFIDKYYTKKDKYFEKRGPYRSQPLEAAKSMGERRNLVYDIPGPNGVLISPKRQWLWKKGRVLDALDQERLEFNKDKEGNWTVSIKQYLYDEDGNEKSLKVTSIIENFYTQHGTKEIESLFGTVDYFPYPKPSALIKHLVNFSTDSDEDEIVLDFFAGSGTTAQAVLELNEDGGNRRFICVQMPEKTDKESEAKKAGFDTIADITQERIKRVIEKIEKHRSGSLELDKRQPLGFRKYRLEGSNFKIWRGDVATNEEELKQQMELFVVPQRANATTENILWELLIKNGYPLTEPVQAVTLADGEVIYHTQDKRLALVLDSFTPAVQDQILTRKPKAVLILDSLFAGRDNDKTNAQLKFEDNGITFRTI